METFLACWRALYFGVQMALAKGWTKDGWEFRVSWSRWDGKFRVEFTNEHKEVWVLETFVVEDKEKVQLYANDIGFRLQKFGSDQIRGDGKAKETHTFWGKAVLVMRLATPVTPVALAEVLREQRAAEMEASPPLLKPAALLKSAASRETGLGSAGMRMLRALFENALLETMGVKPTRDMLVKAEGVIYRLDLKYKAVDRDEALEKAILYMLRWVRDEFYFS